MSPRELKPSRVNRQLAMLKSFLGWAAMTGLLPTGPAPPKALPREQRRPRWLDRREQYALCCAVDCGGRVRDILIVALLLNTGLRLHELCALRSRDVQMAARTGLVTVTQGKGEKRRQLPRRHNHHVRL
jgi:integrase